MNAEQLSDLFTASRQDWREDHDENEWPDGECTGCHKGPTQLAQHWNDVGGLNNLCCEACYIESIMCFWASEEESSDT